MIKSKFSFLVYCQFILAISFLFILSYFITTPVFEKKFNDSQVGTLAGILALYLLISYILLQLIKKVFSLKIEDRTIYIRGCWHKNTISADEILSVDLFARSNLSVLIGEWPITTKIELTDGRTIMVPDPFYSNYSDIKKELADSYKEKIIPYKKDTGTNRIKSSELIEPEKIAGNPYICFNTLLLSGIVISSIALQFLPNKVNDIMLPCLVMSVILFFAFGIQMNYFIISGDSVIVRNHYFFWTRKFYKIDDIVATSFEHPYRRSGVFRIVTKDFKSHGYGAGSLREKHWHKLRAWCEHEGIHIAK